ncbi:PAS domain S-box protein [Archangium violaceum]|uniref:PAS domain S-box protein n=1 Tax=Archangium violaceum TaxID=83451 RepID=UPI0019517155|nr:PAS domain S-box protein [Archangium violaceum]QRN93208.1 PAS domain S-box protein [Archangium violaceum]
MTEAQTDAHSSEGLSDDLLRHLHGAILWEADAATVRLSFVSASAAEMFGHPVQHWAVEADFLKKHVHSRDWGRFLETLYRAAAEGGVHTCEHRMHRADGSTLWAQTTIQRSRRSNGVLLVAGLTVDVSRIKERELALGETEAHFRLLVENLRDYGVFMLSADGTVESWTPGAQRLKGYRADEVLGAPLSRFFPPEEIAKETPQRLLDKAELEREAEYVGWMLRKGGTPFWASLTLSAITDDRGRLRGFSNVAKDLTQSKKTEQALRESEEHFRLLVESQDYGVFMVSPTGAVETWNRGAQRLEGYRAHEVIGSPVSVLFPPDVAGNGLPERLLMEAARVGRAEYEGWLVRKGGEDFWGLLTISAVEDEGGRLRGFSILARDVTQRKRTEQELRRSEEYFRLLIGSVQDYGVFMLSTRGTVESWNQGAQRLKGYRAQEIIGSPISRFFPPEEIEKHTPERLVEQALLKGSATYEGWMVRKGGDRFWALATLSAVEDAQGNLQGISNVAKDLTERKKTEDTLRESEEQLRLLIDSLQDYGVFMLSPDGRIASWSPGAERMKRYKAEEIIGVSVTRFFRPEELKKGILENLLRRAETEGRAEFEGWMVRKGGSTFWASLILSAVRDREGRLHGFSNVARDLTERMRAEQAMSFLSEVGTVLAGSLDYHTTLNTVARLATRALAQTCVVEMLEDSLLHPVAVAHVDPDLEQLVQKAMRSIPNEPQKGHGVARVVQTGQSELLPDLSDVGWIAEALGLAEPTLLSDLGAQSYLCVPLTARGKTFGAMVLVANPGRSYDSEDLRLAEELARRAALAIDNARLYEQAQTAVRIREEILAVVSHDLRNPLTIIRTGAAQLLSDARGAEPRVKTPRIIERIGRAAERMIHMIRDLLDFSSIEAGQLRIEVAAHTANGIATENVEMLQAIAAEKGVRLEKDLEPSNLKVRCDRDRIMQVLSNLVGNAIKFTGEGGSVVVRTRGEDDRVVFSVSDTGPGIAEKDRAHIFDRYWQANRSARDSFGLGLAITKALIESHGGKIWIDSTEGQGTTFFFTLPRDG